MNTPESGYEQLRETSLRQLAEELADETGLPAATWRTAYDTADDEDTFERVVTTWRTTRQNPIELATAFRADQEHNPIPTLYSIRRLPTWDQRERAARSAIESAKGPVSEFAKLRRQALADGLAQTGSPATMARQIGVSRQAVTKALNNPKET